MGKLTRFAHAQPQYQMQQNYLASNLMQSKMRHFSSKQPKKDDYESGFEDLLKQGKSSEAQKQEFDKKLKEKEEKSRQ